MGVTAKNAIPYPELAEPADVPADMREMAERLDGFGYVPPGAMFMWPGAAAPAGFYLLQGQTDIPAATNPILAGLFGAAGGMITLPDLRDAFPIGASATKALLSRGGEATVLLTANQSGQRSHAHGDSFAVASVTQGPAGWNFVIGNGSTATGKRDGTGSESFPVGAGGGGSSTLYSYIANSHVHGLAGSVAAAAALNAAETHNNLPPFLAVNYIIRGG